MDYLEGTVERITYQNDENGYSVLRFQPTGQKGIVTVIGELLSVSVGEGLALKGWWVTHPRYGRQFKIVEYKSLVPATITGIEKYLGSGLIKGIGPVTAKRIVKHFRLDTLRVIEEDIERLSEVEGVGPKRVEMIAKAWEEQKHIKDVMIFLQAHNVSTTYATKIYRAYEDQAIEIVRENPYRLADDIYGIGFRTADRIADSMGVEKSSFLRLTAGLKYVLSQFSEDGHTYAPKEELLAKSSEILENPTELIAPPLDRLEQNSEVIIEGDNIYLPPFYYAEVGVAGRLRQLLRRKPRISYVNFDKIIARIERIKGIRFADNQREAMWKALVNKVMILTGGPGTGKTTTTIGILELMKQQSARVLLAAPTGRAAKRLSETTGYEAKTIHRLLEYSFQRGGFQRNQDNPLPADVVIIDEASMVDLLLMNNLLKAIPSTASLILVGDVDQLPAVGAGNVLKDIIASGMVEVVCLTEIFRQARESLIIVNAHRINKGMFPLLRGGRKQDFYLIEEEDPERVVEIIKELCARRLQEYYGYDSLEDIQVLCPMYRGIAGANNLNKVLQDTFVPATPTDSWVRGRRGFRLGDKVMQIINNYDKDVFNGDIGRIVRIDDENQVIDVQYADSVVSYEYPDLDEIVLAYAISVHKSQGSEYRAVVLPLLTQHYMMLQRNLLYTAVTRAKELVVIVGTKKAMGIAIRNNKIERRYSSLAERIKGTIEEKVRY